MKKLLMIGAGFLQSFVIKKAKQLGYYVIAIDGDQNAIGFNYSDEFAVIDIVNKNECLNYAKSKNIDGVLTAATDYGVLTASFISSKMNLPGLDYRVAKLIKNKYQVEKIFIDNRIDDVTQAFEVDINTDYTSFQNISFPVMVKPCDGSGSRGAQRVDSFDELKKACFEAISFSKIGKALIETFIEGKEYGAESIVVNGEIHVLAIMQKWMTNPPLYAELGHALPNDLSSDINLKAISCVKNAISALGINYGAVNMDIIITKTGNIHIVDVGARMGGNMIGPCIIPYGTGIDYMKAIIASSLGEPIDLSPHSPTPVASRILAFHKGIVKQLPNLAFFEKKYGLEIYHHLEIGQIVNEYHTNLDGMGYIISRADNIEMAIKNVSEALLTIERDVLDYNEKE